MEEFWIAWMGICLILAAAPLRTPRSTTDVLLNLAAFAGGILGYLVGAVGFIIAHGDRPPLTLW